jgi:hypothetical protein
LKANVTVKPNLADSDRFEKMLASECYQMLAKRITSELERARQACERVADPMELHRAQGAVTAYRTVLSMPAIILAEMKK